MPQRIVFPSLGFGRKEWEKSIDMGGGRTVRPEDLLEGHFQRLAGRRPGSEEVTIQVDAAGSTVLRVSAPSLAPLAEVAEELATRMTTVQPSAGFRDQLHRSLEEAHRRQMEERRLHPVVRHADYAWVWIGIAAGGLAILAAGLVILLRDRRGNEQAGKRADGSR